MIGNTNSQPPNTIWAYAYQILPPQAEDRLHTVKALLDQENVAAQRAARVWTGRIVVEPQITHILVVSDSAEQNREVNLRLEAALKELDAGFSLTTPLAVDRDPAALPSP